MKIRILSDLHLEFCDYEIEPLDIDAQSVLVLAGDTGPLRPKIASARVEALVRDASERFLAVIFICGNHEFYNGVWPTERRNFMARGFPANVHILERESVTLEDDKGAVTFFGATLWSNFENGDPFSMHDVQMGLADYRAIFTEGLPDHYGRLPNITPQSILSYHRETIDWLMDAVPAARAQGDRTVLVTHHAMSEQSVHPRWKNNPINGGFVSAEESVLIYTKPDLAIHGHTHDGFDYIVGGQNGEPAIRVVANPRGYTRPGDTHPENYEFNPRLVIEI